MLVGTRGECTAPIRFAAVAWNLRAPNVNPGRITLKPLRTRADGPKPMTFICGNLQLRLVSTLPDEHTAQVTGSLAVHAKLGSCIA